MAKEAKKKTLYSSLRTGGMNTDASSQLLDSGCVFSSIFTASPSWRKSQSGGRALEHGEEPSNLQGGAWIWNDVED